MHILSLLYVFTGELVCDLEYKRVYITNVMRLALIPTWQKQRILRPDRLSRIIDAKVRAKTTSRLPGVISVFHNAATGEVGIVDGQVQHSTSCIFNSNLIFVTNMLAVT